MLCESYRTDIAMPEFTFICGPGFVFLLGLLDVGLLDVDSLTQLGCEHVSRFRRACHITFSVASIHVCMHGVLTLGISVYHTNVLMFTYRRIPQF